MTNLPRTTNEGHGFYGTMVNQGRNVDAAWDHAMQAIMKATGSNQDEVRAFLDSRSGRHFADSVTQTGSLKKAIAAAVSQWAAWKISRRTAATYDATHLIGWSYLTAMVLIEAVAAECEEM